MPQVDEDKDQACEEAHKCLEDASKAPDRLQRFDSEDEDERG